MKTPKIIDDKKTRRYKSGDVVFMEYEGDGRPCDKAMAILITPITTKDNVIYGTIHTMYAIDTDKEEFLKSGPISNTTCTIAKATPKMKAWFFEQIVKQFQKPAEPQYVWVFTAEQAWDGEVADTIVMAFPTEKSATDYLHGFLLDDGGDESIRQYVERKGWVTEEDSPMLYRAFKDGYYNTDHIELTITKCEIQK